MRPTVLIALLALAVLGRYAPAQSLDAEFRDCETCPAMIALPAGTFAMGSDSALSRPDEHPVHDVHVAAFAIGKTEVTRDQYRAFAEATRRDAPGGCTTDADHDGRWQAQRTQPGSSRASPLRGFTP